LRRKVVTHDQPSGTGYIGGIRCGTHLCEFHNTDEELAERLVPYFSAGLRQDEFCLWVTSDPAGAEGAKIGLRKAAPYLDRYLDLGQIEIWDYRDWYLRGGYFDADRVLGQWVEKEKRALDAGYKVLRLTGDTAWVEKKDWPDFMAYEAEVNRVFPQHRMIGLCTYHLDRCTPDAVLEVVRNHHTTRARIAGEWEMIESSRFRETSEPEQLQRLSADVLEQQDDERRWIANQLHEVTAQNVSAIAIHIANLQQMGSWPSAVKLLLARCHALCEQSLEHILTISHLLHPPVLDELGLAACLRRYVEDFKKRSRIHVELETGMEIGRLPLQIETHLFRVAQEGLSNILRHSGSLNAIVRLHRQADEVVLEVEDFGAGITATATAAVSDGAGKGGIGILGMQERLRKIGGQLEIRSNNQGTLLTASIRVS
jgi:signal transduction histidine kinase